MERRARSIAALIAAAAAAGCAGMGYYRAPGPVQRRAVAAPLPRAFKASIAALEELGYAVREADPAAGCVKGERGPDPVRGSRLARACLKALGPESVEVAFEETGGVWGVGAPPDHGGRGSRFFKALDAALRAPGPTSP